jgi:2,4-dienoyl-CoA reductase-like NADH-dependent reductase (Old Yellow Enzyme family)/thioredoxin reductase
MDQATAPSREPQPTDPRFRTLFSPVTVGTMRLKNRVMSPPHTSAIGSLYGTEADAERNMAYWDVRAKAGVSWIDIPGRMRNFFITGFEPSGISAETLGWFRLPNYVERVGAFVNRMKAHGAYVTCQMTMLGAFPHAPSPTLSAPIANPHPHVLTVEEIRAFVEEYRYAASRVAEAGAAGIELHFNHDDLLEWFLSPLTNRRDDAYGGSFEKRARFPREILAAIRAEVGRDLTVGVRLNVEEPMPGGYDAEGGIAIARMFEETGDVDFIHAVVGTPWGNPSYIQSHFYKPGEWAHLAGAIKRAVSIPVVYTGLVNGPAVAEDILSQGHADVVGMARAMAADGELLAKARDGHAADIRPCVGGNECISRRYVDGLPFGCAVNPHTSREVDGPWPAARTRRSLLIVGGGPAGMELAALAAESGHTVTLWEAQDRLGGLINLAVRAPTFDRYGDYIGWQARRLERLGVEIVLGRTATAANVMEAQADSVAFATGTRGAWPDIPASDDADVMEAREVLSGAKTPGRRVLIVARDDHMPPLALADFLSLAGHQVTMVYGTPSAAILLGRYIAGAPLGRLDERGVEIRTLQEVVAIRKGEVDLRNVYSGKVRPVGGIDTVVLSCGGVSETALFDAVRAQRGDVHVLGDAYAPRRMVFATRQAYALAKELAG